MFVPFHSIPAVSTVVVFVMLRLMSVLFPKGIVLLTQFMQERGKAFTRMANDRKAKAMRANAQIRDLKEPRLLKSPSPFYATLFPLQNPLNQCAIW